MKINFFHYNAFFHLFHNLYRGMTQNVNLQGHDSESQRHSFRSTIFCKYFPHPTHEHTCEVSLRSYWQFLWKTCAQQKLARTRKKEERTLGQRVWRTLTLCDANYAMKEQPDVNVITHTLKIFLWTFIWHKLGLNTLSS